MQVSSLKVDNATYDAVRAETLADMYLHGHSIHETSTQRSYRKRLERRAAEREANRKQEQINSAMPIDLRKPLPFPPKRKPPMPTITQWSAELGTLVTFPITVAFAPRYTERKGARHGKR